MMYVSLLLLLMGANPSPTYLNSKVTLDDGASVCEITYNVPASASASTLLYKEMGDPSWQVENLSTSAGHLQLPSLNNGSVYVAKLSWQEGADSFESEDHYFVTYNLLASTSPDFSKVKIIQSDESAPSYVHTLYHPKVSFRYKDKYLQTEGNLLGEIVDENKLVLARFFTPKEESGIYHLDLSDFAMQLDVPYELKLSDGRNPDRSFKVMMTDVNDELTASINVNGILIDCDLGGTSTVEFQSVLVGGSAPFEVTWTIADVGAGGLLYGPQVQELPTAQDVSIITVDLALPYVVTMSCFDGCGRFQEYTVVLSCGEENGEDTILIQPLGNNSSNGSGSN